ncbi:uncharacterized protein [Haliotis asinina]|uniref:uncharacterized protein isoform X2 n=1 Tax=Haliotis asinina TaxID=109174 RepID=UPI0035319D55
MEVRSTTTSSTTALHGAMQFGNNNSILYKNCAITYITNITNNCKHCHPAEEHVVSEDTPRDLVPSPAVHTTTRSRVRLVDCQGRELELGDIVETDRIHGIYVGDGMIIGRDRKTRRIVHEPINVEEPFTSCSLLQLGPKYSSTQIVQRARGKVGQKCDYGPADFVFWCCTDMTMEEWIVLEGLQDQEHWIGLLRLQTSLMADH